jgi:hypothetical protein
MRLNVAQNGPETIVKNEDAPHAMRFDCGEGWGFKSGAIAAIGKIEEAMPGQFIYFCVLWIASVDNCEATMGLGIAEPRLRHFGCHPFWLNVLLFGYPELGMTMAKDQTTEGRS